jgi:anthranilate synthase/aminodeoxychorismate synthase-like glutamine amidotransferase
MRVLVLDNHDSFTWNLVQALEALGASCAVHRSDRISLGGAVDLAPERIVISPGPFGPERTGVCPAVLETLSPRVPTLGVCLGFQLIAARAGARVHPSGRPVHGKTSEVEHDGRGLLSGLPSPLRVARYHSLVVSSEELPPSLEPSARTADGTLMGARLAGQPVEGVQFHPESFLTEAGDRLLANFLEGRCGLV